MNEIIYWLCAMIFAALLAFTLTPPVRVFACKIGAVDIPKDNRRMHKNPIPRIGGVAIFAAFTITSLIFCPPNDGMIAIWLGGFILASMGVIDDKYNLHPLIKLAFQFAAAAVALAQGVVISQINIFGEYISFGWLAYPITALWIICLTNAINLIDGLDGLACGVSVICSISLLGVVLLTGNLQAALTTAILAASCLGFLPFNSNPARIFMGDSGALFLGYTMAILSVQGVFKLHTVIAFIIPLSIFALPLFDTVFAFFRRILHGKNPFKGDRGHIHHRLIDMGFTQKQSVLILYAVCGMLGLSAIVFTDAMWKNSEDAHIIIRTVAVFGAAILVFALNFFILRNPSTRIHSGLIEHEPTIIVQGKNDTLTLEKENGENNTGDGADSKNE